MFAFEFLPCEIRKLKLNVIFKIPKIRKFNFNRKLQSAVLQIEYKNMLHVTALICGENWTVIL